MLRGRKLSSEPIAVQGVDDAKVMAAARATVGFSGGSLWRGRVEGWERQPSDSWVLEAGGEGGASCSERTVTGWNPYAHPRLMLQGGGHGLIPCLMLQKAEPYLLCAHMAYALRMRPLAPYSLPTSLRLLAPFSGRELAKFMAAVQASVYGSAEATLTPAIWDAVLLRKLYEHQERRNFRLGHHGTPGDADEVKK